MAMLCLALVIGCDNAKPEDAPYPDPSDAAPVQVAEQAAASMPSVTEECRGFADNSARAGTLGGIALGDHISQVTQQLRCGEVVFELREDAGINYDQEYSRLLGANRPVSVLRGRSGTESIGVHFVGLAGEERVIKVTRSGEYDEVPGPSVKAFVANISKRFPEAREIPRSGGYRREFGFSYRANGDPISDPKDMSSCANQHNFEEECGLGFSVYFVNDYANNPDLVADYGATLTNGAATRVALEAAKTKLRVTDAKRRASEVERGGKVQGF